VVKALQAKGELSPKPTVTLQRQGDVGDAKPIIGQVYIVEI